MITRLSDYFLQHPELAAQFSPENDPSLLRRATGSSEIALWVCPTCSSSTAVEIGKKVKKPATCSVCAGLVIVAGVNDLASQHPEVAAEWAGVEGELSPQEVSSASAKYLTWRCLTDASHELWKARIADRTRGEGVRQSTCPTCAKERARQKRTASETHRLLPDGDAVPQIMREFFQGFVDKGSGRTPFYDSPYIHCYWRCDKGHEWQSRADTFSNRLSCPTCTTHLSSLGTKRPDLLASWSPTNTILLQEVTLGSAYRASWICDKKPSHVWEASVYARVNGSGCPHCTNMVSVAEREVADYIKSVLPSMEVRTTERRVVNPHELDIYIPEKHFAVEFNGLYWHSEEAGKGRNYHRNKWSACRAQGIQLVQVWEDEWARNSGQVKRMLAHKLGVPYGVEPRVMARKTQVVVVDVVTARTFYGEHHVQGYARASYYLALVEKDQDAVVAMLAVKKEPGTRGRVLNIIRYATAAVVPGGFTKLLTYAERTYRPDKFITFSDHCVSDGGLYENNGFVADKELKPDYMYLVDGERVHKFNYRLKRFRDDPGLIWEEGLSESELAKLNKLPRIWDAGKTRWVKVVEPS